MNINGNVTHDIVDFLDKHKVEYKVYRHHPSATSEESAVARAQAGAGKTTGAKALLLNTKQHGFVVCVIPGYRRLDNKRVRTFLGKYSFATAGEMASVARGLQPGTMPPFGPQIFPDISRLIIDGTIRNESLIGFNAACSTTSIVMSGKEFCQVSLKHADFIEISTD